MSSPKWTILKLVCLFAAIAALATTSTTDRVSAQEFVDCECERTSFACSGPCRWFPVRRWGPGTEYRYMQCSNGSTRTEMWGVDCPFCFPNGAPCVEGQRGDGLGDDDCTKDCDPPH